LEPRSQVAAVFKAERERDAFCRVSDFCHLQRAVHDDPAAAALCVKLIALISTFAWHRPVAATGRDLIQSRRAG
jgi:hypothetical protein